MEKRPIGWREDLRTYHIMRSFSEIKSKPEAIFPSLLPIFARQQEASDGQKLRGSAMHNFMLKAHGGDIIEGL